MAKKKTQKTQKNQVDKLTKTPTQRYIDISEIHDDTLVLRDNTMVSVLLCSSINFALKSEEEQNAIIQGYITFINSINFPVQIVIQSRRLDIKNYLIDLKGKEKEQINELLRVQIREYRNYIEQLVEMGDIMTKKFYVVIRYNPQEGIQREGIVKQVLGSFKAVDILGIKKEKFRKYRQELDRRVGVVQSGLSSMMVNSELLDTQGLIELFYNTYNPGVAERQKMAGIGKLRID